MLLGMAAIAGCTLLSERAFAEELTAVSSVTAQCGRATRLQPRAARGWPPRRV
jgi:hypothetical protein